MAGKLEIMFYALLYTRFERNGNYKKKLAYCEQILQPQIKYQNLDGDFATKWVKMGQKVDNFLQIF